MILAIDSSSLSAGVALVRDGVLLAEAFQNVGLTHSVTLGPMLHSLFANSGLGMEEVQSVAVSNGPGSFTGLRIGIASALGFAEARGIPCVGVSSLRAAAYNAVDSGALVRAVMDARRGEVYTALFRAQKGELVRLEPDRAVRQEDLPKPAERLYWVGDAVGLCCGDEDSLSARSFVSAYGVALCVLHGHTRPLLPPVYLRKPQAEREREARNTAG